MATLKTKRGSEIKPGDYIGYTAGFALELRRVKATYETETWAIEKGNHEIQNRISNQQAAS